jgi:hypothetical protein
MVDGYVIKVTGSEGEGLLHVQDQLKYVQDNNLQPPNILLEGVRML